uniref:Myb/SANT-like DNA-binding domain-containing protein n=1 Tax=Paramormyrops kingsleyae TaxID=1676925 RepID=A0A3B3QY72_9TELE
MEGWTNEETQALIAIWSDEQIQRDLDGTTRNKKVFAIISSRLEDMGHTRTTEQCRLKIKKLKQDYRKLKDHNNRSGADRETNTWFEALDAVLGHRPTNTCRSNIVDCGVSPVISSQATEEHSVTEDNSGKMKYFCVQFYL